MGRGALSNLSTHTHSGREAESPIQRKYSDTYNDNSFPVLRRISSHQLPTVLHSSLCIYDGNSQEKLQWVHGDHRLYYIFKVRTPAAHHCVLSDYLMMVVTELCRQDNL